MNREVAVRCPSNDCDTCWMYGHGFGRLRSVSYILKYSIDVGGGGPWHGTIEKSGCSRSRLAKS